MAINHAADDGNDGDTGGEFDPFLTLAKLKLETSNGDTAKLARGDKWAQQYWTQTDAASEGQRITLDVFGSGNLPVIDWEDVDAGNFIPIVWAGNYNTVKNWRVINGGPTSGSPSSGEDNGTLGFQCRNGTDVVFEDLEVNRMWNRGIYHNRVRGAGNITRGCKVTRCGRNHHVSGFDQPVIIACSTPLDSAASWLCEDNFVHEVHGEAIGTWWGFPGDGGTIVVQNNEMYACEKMGVYINAAKHCTVQRNIVYGSTDSTYHRHSGYCGACYSTAAELEPQGSQEDPEDAEAMDDIDIYHNVGAFCLAGMYMTNSGNGGAGKSTTQNSAWDQCTFVDCLGTFWMDIHSTRAGNNSIRANMSLPIDGNSNHAYTNFGHSNNVASGNNMDWTFWYSGSQAKPSGSETELLGSNDRESTTPILAKMTGWVSNNSAGSTEADWPTRDTGTGIKKADFNPTTDVTALDLGYNQDLYQDGITHDSFGAIAVNPPEAVPGTINLDDIVLGVNEDAGSITVSATRTGGTDGAISVDLTDLGTGTAVAETHYTTLAPTTTHRLAWADTVGSSDTVAIAILDTSGVEGPRTIICEIQNAIGGVTIGANKTVTITIQDVSIPAAGVGLGGGVGISSITGKFEFANKDSV